VTSEITAAEIARIRGLLTAKPPEPIDHCDPDCEHIECGYVVACEKYTAAKAQLATLIEPLLDALEQSHNARVPLELTCPKCNLLHVDQDEWAHEIAHRTHLCHGCGNLWRPYPVGTVGVDVHAPCRARRDELLALVDKVSRETPYPADLDECKSARAALIAEVGTLKARVIELESMLP
jgi:hypothetical protein